MKKIDSNTICFIGVLILIFLIVLMMLLSKLITGSGATAEGFHLAEKVLVGLVTIAVTLAGRRPKKK